MVPLRLRLTDDEAGGDSPRYCAGSTERLWEVERRLRGFPVDSNNKGFSAPDIVSPSIV